MTLGNNGAGEGVVVGGGGGGGVILRMQAF